MTLQSEKQTNLKAKRVALSGWGRATPVEMQAFRPERMNEMKAIMQADAERGLVARGMGRSYGDEATNAQGHVVLMERLNRILAFDEETHEVVCEAGVTLHDLLTTFLPRGLYVPVTPGTAYITLGGAVANDVHGKNHEKMGSFGQHVIWLDLMLPDGSVRHVTPSAEPELFKATIGGLGLTGIILQVCVRLQPMANTVQVTEQRIPDLAAFFEAFQAQRERATFSVGWIDGLAKGINLGRGILETAEFVDEPRPYKAPRQGSSVPMNFPPGVLNKQSIKVFNQLYYRHISAKGRTREVTLPQFLYPLDKIQHWNRIYGAKGFYQFQCVIPDAQAQEGIRALLETISDGGSASFLGVLKTLGGDGLGYLSFPMRGYTLALDFPRNKRNIQLLQQLEAITLAHSGRIYLAKDALLSPEGFRAMYPRYREFYHVITKIDPEGRMQSDLARRLALREMQHGY